MTSPTTPTDDRGPRCEDCRWSHVNWRKGDTHEYWSEQYNSPPSVHTRASTSVQCRRHAPAKAMLENDQDGWPWISGDDWCGEFLAKEPVRAALAKENSDG